MVDGGWWILGDDHDGGGDVDGDHDGGGDVDDDHDSGGDVDDDHDGGGVVDDDHDGGGVVDDDHDGGGNVDDNDYDQVTLCGEPRPEVRWSLGSLLLTAGTEHSRWLTSASASQS